MSHAKVGDRVGAVCCADESGVQLYGFGIYEGDFVRPDGVPGIFGTPEEIRTSIAEEISGKVTNEEASQIIDALLKNPRILLDNGHHVWGCQCWWGPEEKIKKTLEGRNVIVVPTPEEENEQKKETI